MDRNLELVRFFGNNFVVGRHYLLSNLAALTLGAIKHNQWQRSHKFRLEYGWVKFVVIFMRSRKYKAERTLTQMNGHVFAFKKIVVSHFKVCNQGAFCNQIKRNVLVPRQRSKFWWNCEITESAYGKLTKCKRNLFTWLSSQLIYSHW